MKEKHDQQKNQESQDKEEQQSEPKSKEQELTNDLQRVQAEFENFKKRCEKENAEFREYAKAELIEKLLPLLDNFELALSNTGKESHQEFVKGIELIYSQFITLLEDEGLQVIKAKGEKFDPFMHEALLTEQSDKEEDTVLEEMQKGYLVKDKVIRHAKVKVAKK